MLRFEQQQSSRRAITLVRLDDIPVMIHCRFPLLDSNLVLLSVLKTGIFIYSIPAKNFLIAPHNLFL